VAVANLLMTTPAIDESAHFFSAVSEPLSIIALFIFSDRTTVVEAR
jgi:hypothetical protein